MYLVDITFYTHISNANYVCCNIVQDPEVRIHNVPTICLDTFAFEIASHDIKMCNVNHGEGGLFCCGRSLLIG